MAVSNTIYNYSNLPNRSAGKFTLITSRLFAGARKVQQQIVPYAEAWTKANLAAQKKSGPLWVVLGDSMSQSIGASAYDRGWVSRLQVRLKRAGQDYRIINLSISGARVSDVLERQIPAMNNLGAKPDLITVLIGSNDMASTYYRRRLSENYLKLLSQLPARTVIVSPFGNFGTGAAVNRLIQRQADDHGLIVVENKLGAGLSSWKGKLAEDHFHPNDQGYEQLASVFFGAIIANFITPPEAAAVKAA